MAITPITRYGKFTPTGVDQTEARKLEALAGVGQKVTQAAVAHGQQKIQERKEETRRAELEKKKTDALLEQELVNSSILDHDAHLTQLSEEYSDDPTQYLERSMAFTNGMLESMTPSVRARLEVDLIGKVRSTHAPLLKNFNANALIASKQSSDNTISTLTVDLDKAIRNKEDIGSIVNNINNAFISRGELDPTYNVAEKQNKLQKLIKYKQIETPILAVADTDAETAAVLYDEALSKVPDGYTQNEWKNTLDSTLVQINTQSSLQKMKRQLGIKEDAKKVTNVVTSLDIGLPVDSQTRDEARQAAQNIGKQDEFAIAEQVNHYARSDAETRNKLMQAAEDSPENAQLVAAMVKSDVARNTALNKSALDWGAKTLRTTENTPIIERVQFENLMYPTQEELANRKENIEIVKNYTGYNNIHLFTEEEKTAFVETLKQINPTEIMGVVNAYGRDSYIQDIVAQEMGDGTTAHAFDKPHLASILFEGKRRSQTEKPSVALQGNAKAQAHGLFTEHTGTGIDSDNYSHYLAAVESYYFGTVDLGTGLTAEETRDGALQYDFNKDKWMEAIQAVVGNTMEFRDKQIILGSHTKEQLETVIENLTVENIQLLTTAQGDIYITEDEADDILELIQDEDRTRLTKLAGIDGQEGNYQVVRVVEINGVEQEKYLASQSGQPIILQLNNEALNKNIASFLAFEEGKKISRRIELNRRVRGKRSNPFGMF